MTKDELINLSTNQRVKMFILNKDFNSTYTYGYVMKIYNGNWQVNVWFDGEPKGRVVGYSQIDIVV